MVLTGNIDQMIITYRSRPVSIGTLHLGGDHPVRIQSMTNTDTNDVEATTEQCEEMIRSGAALVRLTTQGKKEVDNLGRVIQRLRQKGFDTPVVADIHFKPELALYAAPVAQKIRINPGNYIRKGDESIHPGNFPGSLLPTLINACKSNCTAIRIGVNHGSLHESILNQFGDTPLGMAESAMQFLRVCQKEGFHQVVVSLKSSNPRVMVQSTRLLVSMMIREGLEYPLHLGVTEAGNGIEGRIKSVVGLAPLLLEGMGDTIRISLTEPPAEEMPVAKMVLSLFSKPSQLPYDPFRGMAWDPFQYQRRISNIVSGIGGGSPVKIITSSPPAESGDITPELLKDIIISFKAWDQNNSLLDDGDKILQIEKGESSIHEVKKRLSRFCTVNKTSPVIFKISFGSEDPQESYFKLAGELGFLLVDGYIDAIHADLPLMDKSVIYQQLLTILQAAGSRRSRTEFVSCPSCGRTHFDIVSRLKEIKEATSHLKELKIAIMGCIVNGPGEMADAHYGYVGAGPGKITLYKSRIAVKKGLPEKNAVEALIELIKMSGDWKEPG